MARGMRLELRTDTRLVHRFDEETMEESWELENYDYWAQVIDPPEESSLGDSNIAMSDENDVEQTGFGDDDDTPPVAPGTYVTTDYLNVRSTPDTSTGEIATLPPGTQVTVLSDPAPNGGFVAIAWGDGQQAYVHSDWLRASSVATTGNVTTAPATAPSGQVGPIEASGNYNNLFTNFVGTNYRALGHVDNIYEELRHLRDDYGIYHVRVWPFAGDGNLEDWANRAAAIAEAAAALGMTVTIDFMDGHNNDDYRNYSTEDLQARMRAITEACAEFDNITWSIGNELQSREEPAEFAQWYIEQAVFLRDLVGDDARIAGHFVPGAFGHPPEALALMESVVPYLDEVSIHLYPEGTPSTNAGNQELDTLLVWLDLANRYGVDFTVGEFAVDGVGGIDQGVGGRTPEQFVEWITFFDSLPGVDRVDLWQFDVNLPWDGDNLGVTDDGEVQRIREALPYLN